MSKPVVQFALVLVILIVIVFTVLNWRDILIWLCQLPFIRDWARVPELLGPAGDTAGFLQGL